MSRNNNRVARRMDSKYVKRRQRGLAVLVASLVLIVGAIGYIGIQKTFGGGGKEVEGADFEGTGNGVMKMVEIPEGSSMSELGGKLVELNVVKTDGAFQTAAANNPDAGKIQPGFVRLQEEMSAKAAVDALLSPENKVDLLDIPGGATLADLQVIGGDKRFGIYSMIEQASCQYEQEGKECVKKADLEKVAGNADLSALGVPDWAMEDIKKRGNDPKRLEGLIVPGQYVLNPDMDAQEILTDLITRSTKSYEDSGIETRAEAIGLTPYELLTSASLVEREAPSGEFGKVARVILNRLEEPMRLEFDSTVNYGLEDVELATTDEHRAEKTPWNTYAKDGLPETPIASPSMEAIEAMEKPTEGDWLFFVTIDDKGTTVFTDDYDEHLKNVDKALNSGILDQSR